MKPPNLSIFSPTARRHLQSLLSAFKPSLLWETPTSQQTHFLAFRHSFHQSISPGSPLNAVSSLLLLNKPLEAANLIDRSPPTAQLPPKLYNSVLAALSSNGFSNPARKLFDRMLERRVIFNDVGFGCFVKRLCGSEDLDKILSFVEEVKELGCTINGSVVAVLIVDGFCRAGKIEEAWTALDDLRRIGWKPDFIAYRVVSEGFRLANRVEEAGRILKQKRKFGVAPRANDYSEFVLSLIAERRIREAKELGEVIISGDFPMDDDVLNSLICSVSDVDSDSAILFLKYMIGKDRFPSLPMLRYLSRNILKDGKSDEMWDVYRVLSDKGHFSGVEQYNTMVSFLCEVGKLREAYDVLKEMKKRGFGPDASSYNCLMEACCREDLLRPAKKLWDEMFANGCYGNLRTYTILIQKLSEEGEVEESMHLFHDMMEKGVAPDIVTYKSLIKMLCREKNLERALEVFNKAMEQEVVLAKTVLSTLILSLCKQGNYAAASSAMRGIPSYVEDSDSHVILLRSLTDAGEAEMAINHIEWIRENSPCKLQSVLTELIASLSTAPKLEPVLQLLKLMHARGLVSSDDPFMKLVEGSHS